ncbi:6-carboxytetrahydropterin synthase QueD [Candidatus Gracilibacteria bacterium]|jgi:6-pyruvoyltetrahydropterin/6-carboxytetrahydropterin synthase|nr:6-carboxytetrahydropterin synthase QueD [Candidatus Gracilibacteria bacterium]
MPIVKLNCTLSFAASHFLTKYKGKCENLHGHNYKVIITVEDEIKENGLAIDFKDIKKIAEEKVINILDHAHLNDIIENPSAENIAVWTWEKLKKDLPLKKVTIFETEDYYCEYEGK